MLHYRKVNHLWEFVLWVRRSSKSAKMRSSLLVKYELLFSWNICLSGIQVSCPYLYCNSKNSQFQHAGRFPSGESFFMTERSKWLINKPKYCSEFVLNHLHSSHKHRRFNGDSLDMTMVVPQVEVEQNSNTIRWTVMIWLEQLGKLECFLIRKAGSTTTLNGSDSKDRELRLPSGPSTTQTWPFVEVYCNKRYFYLEAQSYIIDGHPELFLWLWFLGNNKTHHWN